MEHPPPDPCSHAHDFAIRWADKLEEYSTIRMRELGIADHMNGQSDYDGDGRWRAFNPDGRQGGENTTGVVSDSLVLNDCRVPDSAVIFRSDDIRPFRNAFLNWFWGAYTAVYLGVAAAAYDEVRKVVAARQPQGYAQPLAYHADVRRHVAEMSVDLEAARLIAVVAGAI